MASEYGSTDGEGYGNFYLASLWSFTPKGVEFILNKLTMAMEMSKDENSQCDITFDSAVGIFKVTCPIHLEEDLNNAFDCALEDIAKIDVGDLRSALTRIKDDADTPARDSQRTARKEPFRKQWTAILGESDGVGIHQVLPSNARAQLQQELDILVMCKDERGRAVYVEADSEELVEKGLQRLDAVLALAKAPVPSPRHVLYPEGYVETGRADGEFTVDARYVANFSAKHVSTILLAPENMDHGFYGTIITDGAFVRLRKWNRDTMKHLSMFGPMIIGTTSQGPIKRYLLGNRPRPSTIVGPGNRLPFGEHASTTHAPLLELGPEANSPVAAASGAASAVETLIDVSEGGVDSKTPAMTGRSSIAVSAPDALHKEDTGHGLEETSDFVREMNTAFGYLLKNVSALRGEVSLHIDFGRIILTGISEKDLAFNDPSDESKGVKKHSLLRWLNDVKNAKKVIFTTAISTNGYDAELLTLVRHEGMKMWQEVQDTSIVYSFLCRAESSRLTFALDIIDENDGSMSYRFRNLPDLRRTIAVHGLCRNWDARIMLSSTDVARFEATYGEFAKAFLEHLEIRRSDDHQPQIWYMNRQNAEVQVLGVRLLTKWQHLSQDGQSALRITEVQQMAITESTKTGGSAMTLRLAQPWSKDFVAQEEERGCFGTWYEASIISTRAGDFFEQNKHLGVGARAEYSVHDLHKAGVFSALYVPAAEMLRQMDQVGAGEDNKQLSRFEHKLPRDNDLPKPAFHLGDYMFPLRLDQSRFLSRTSGSSANNSSRVEQTDAGTQAGPSGRWEEWKPTGRYRKGNKRRFW